MQLRRTRQMIVNIIDDPEEYPFHYSTYEHISDPASPIEITLVTLGLVLR